MDDLQPERCPACSGQTATDATGEIGSTHFVVFACGRCDNRFGRIKLGPSDPPRTHDLARRKMTAILRKVPA